jgi:hypothetical protein
MKVRIIFWFLFVASVISTEAQGIQRFYVYKDGASSENHGCWTNYMPENARIFLNMAAKEARRGDSSIKITFDCNTPPYWCGIAVSTREDYWGDRSGPGYNLAWAKKLVFYAKGQRGGETLQFKIAILGDKPYGDSNKLPVASPWVKLTSSYRRYEMDLSGQNLSRVVTPFCIVTNKAHNDNGQITFYIDEIYFE